MSMGVIILGFCKLREKLVSDTTINGEFCKDRAVISLAPEKKETA